MAQHPAAVVVVSFWFFFFVETVDKWITGPCAGLDILLTRPCEKIGQTAELFHPLGILKPVPEVHPAACPRGPHEDRTLSWSEACIVQGWFRGHITSKEIVA